MQHGSRARRRCSAAAAVRSGRRRTPCRCRRRGRGSRSARLTRRRTGSAARRCSAAVAFVEPVIRVQLGIAVVLVGAAREPVRARRVTKLIETAPWPPTSAPPAAVVTRHGFDRILPRPDGREEPVRRLVEVVVVADAVQRDVQERLRQSVDRGVAARTPVKLTPTRNVTPPSRGRVSVSASGRSGPTLSVATTVAVCVLISSRCAADLDGFRQLADLERCIDRGRDAGLHAHIGDHGGLEPLQRHGHGVRRRSTARAR